MTPHPFQQAFDSAGRGGRGLLALLRFSFVSALFLGFDVFVDGSPQTWKEVVERANARNVVQRKPAEDIG